MQRQTNIIQTSWNSPIQPSRLDKGFAVRFLENILAISILLLVGVISLDLVLVRV